MPAHPKLIAQFLGPVLFFLILGFGHPTGLPLAGVAVLATTVWIALWWIFEVTSISVTALLPIILFPLTGALSLSTTTAAYGHKYIFLYLGGFMLAIAIEKWNLHQRIALTIIDRLGVGISRIILGFMAATAFMSMWISNTATAVMMLPIGLAIVKQLEDHPDTPVNEQHLFGKALMLAIAYSASIGGIATLIGTPPNLVLAGVVEELYDTEITFAQWFAYGLPISITLLILCWLYLTRIAFRFEMDAFPGGEAEIKRLLAELGPITSEEKRVLFIFAATAMLWMFRSPLQTWIPNLDDAIIAMLAGISLFMLPNPDGKPLLEWSEAVKLPWGIILLFGGGMALAIGFQSSGLANWIGTQATLLEGLPLLLLLFVLIASVNFLTEITSNLATTAMLLPILAPIALTLGLHPFILMVAAATAASCAFMLPVATPPNAVVFGSGYLQIPDMMKTGIWMNLFSIFLLTAMVYFVLSWLWGFDPQVFPLEFMPENRE